MEYPSHIKALNGKIMVKKKIKSSNTNSMALLCIAVQLQFSKVQYTEWSFMYIMNKNQVLLNLSLVISKTRILT